MCRSFLSPWKDENGDYKFEGRFNMGVVSLNLPQMGIIADTMTTPRPPLTPVSPT